MSETNNYGGKVKFSKEAVIKFPDFNLRFLGSRTMKSNTPQPFLFTYYDFEVECQGEKKNISLSSGTGGLAPTFFNCNNKNFQLELRRSSFPSYLGNLAEDELVVNEAIAQ